MKEPAAWIFLYLIAHGTWIIIRPPKPKPKPSCPCAKKDA